MTSNSPLRHALLSLTFVAATAQAAATLAVKPLAREQVTAFGLARGFSAEAIAGYANACVLSFNFKNDRKMALRFRLADWTAGDGVRLRPLKDWETEWEQRGVPSAARIAFRWAQFPAEQEFEAGDWIMGMAVPQRPIAGRFRITARYTDEKGNHELVSNTVTCAK